MSEKVKREDKSAGEEPEPFAKRVKKEDSEDEAPLKTKSKKQTIQVSTCVLVTGTEYKDIALRDKLKSLGATWHKPLVGWVLPESARASVEKVINGGELSAAEVAASSAEAAGDDPAPSESAGAKLFVAPHKKVCLSLPPSLC